MNEDTLYTRGEFLKIALGAVAVFFAGGLFGSGGQVARMFRGTSVNAYGNNTYGDKA